MRTITITYEYDGPEEAWKAATSAFIEAVSADADVAGKFTYQVATADDGKSRVHWGRWDTPDTLATVQSRDYFKTFAARVGEFASGAQIAMQSNVANKTSGW